MAHGDAREGKWRGNWQMEWVASTIHTTFEHVVSSITTAYILAASSRVNWCPRQFKWTCPFRQKTKSGFWACAITFQLASTSLLQYLTNAGYLISSWPIMSKPTLFSPGNFFLYIYGVKFERLYWIMLWAQMLAMILHSNYKSSNTFTKPFFPLLRKILLILDRRNKSAHVRTHFTSCLNQFSCNLVNDQKLIWTVIVMDISTNPA